MGCRKVQKILVELGRTELSGPLLDHLAVCSSCNDYARRRELWRAGVEALAAVPVPAPSPGFRTRVMRRLEEAVRERTTSEEFLERAGRRVVYATFVLAVAVLLVLVLPPTGPLRTPANAEISFAEPETQTMADDPVFAEDHLGNRPPAKQPFPQQNERNPR